MANTPKAALPYPASGEAPNGPSQIQALATALDAKVIIPVPNQAARDALGTSGNLTVQRSDTGDYESNYGGTWSRIAGPLVQAKAWRTGGVGPAMVADTFATVDLSAARLSGGFTFDNAANTLTVPQNGHYWLGARGYASGGTGYSFDFRIVRQRSAVADLDVVGSPKGRKPDAFDEVVYCFSTVPLQAGDKLLLRAAFSSSAGTYYGISEVAGLFLEARYVGPLSGATPL